LYRRKQQQKGKEIERTRGNKKTNWSNKTNGNQGSLECPQAKATREEERSTRKKREKLISDCSTNRPGQCGHQIRNGIRRLRRVTEGAENLRMGRVGSGVTEDLGSDRPEKKIWGLVRIVGEKDEGGQV